jgi:DNA-binding transcriptional ArsR family regulator
MAPLVHETSGRDAAVRASFDGGRRVGVDVMEQLVVISRAIGCEARLHLLRVLGEGGRSLTSAAHEAGLAPSTAHHHLGVLVDAGLAVRQRRGRRTLYKWGSTRCSLHFEPAPSSTM